MLVLRSYYPIWRLKFVILCNLIYSATIPGLSPSSIMSFAIFFLPPSSINLGVMLGKHRTLYVLFMIWKRHLIIPGCLPPSLSFLIYLLPYNIYLVWKMYALSLSFYLESLMSLLLYPVMWMWILIRIQLGLWIRIRNPNADPEV